MACWGGNTQLQALPQESPEPTVGFLAQKQVERARLSGGGAARVSFRQTDWIGWDFPPPLFFPVQPGTGRLGSHLPLWQRSQVALCLHVTNKAPTSPPGVSQRAGGEALVGNKGAEARESRLELSVSPSPCLVCHIFQALCEVDSWIRAEEGTKIHTLSPPRLCAVATTQSFRTEGMVSVHSIP